MFDYFSEQTPWPIREQILRYNATQNMSDVERAKFFKLPAGCRMREGAKILYPENLEMGECCWIGENAILDASGGLKIGSHTSIGLTVFVWTHDSHRLNLRGCNTREHSHEIVRKRTEIGSNCFISGPSVVMPGVKIGNKCVVSPLSVVYEDLPDKTVYGPFKNMYDLVTQCNRKKMKQLQDRLERLEEELAALKGGATATDA